MKAIITLGAVALLSASAASAQSTVDVKGHYNANGTYVQPYQRTAPNDTKADNWSSRPNVNPNTGRAGTVDPYAAPKTRTPKPW